MVEVASGRRGLGARRTRRTRRSACLNATAPQASAAPPVALSELVQGDGAPPSTASWSYPVRVVWCRRLSANRTQEETVSASDRPGVLFRAGTSQSKAVSRIGAAAVCWPVAARALRLEGGRPTVAEPGGLAMIGRS